MYPYVRGVSYDTAPAVARRQTQPDDPVRQLNQVRTEEDEEDEEEEEEEEEEYDEYESMRDVGGNPERERKLDEEEKKLQGLDSIYQWMPAEFDVQPDGEVGIASYINNLDRQEHADLYDDIALVFRLFLPLFEQVL
jgi:hypothetical protein